VRLAAARRRTAAGAFLGCLFVAAAGISCRDSAGPGFSGVRNLDVVLVTIDTLRADAPGFMGGRSAATPNLDRLAREGIVFTDAHAHNVITLPSHVNILTGLYPFQHGVRDNDGFRLDARIPTIATLLKAAGYATGAFIGAFPLDSRFGLSRGFDVYDQHYPQGLGAYDFAVAERPAAEVIEAARKWFGENAGKRRFLWVHLYDCHAPYRPPPPFDRQYAGHPYDGEVAGVDAALAPLLEDLRVDAAPALLAVTADHGEALGDHGELTHGLFAYEATLHIPLLLWSPKRLSPGVDRAMARHVDIVPTLLEAAQVPAPAELPGISLLHPRSDPKETSYFEALSASLNRGWAPLRGTIGGSFKLIDLPIPELYDLASDPKEATNVLSREGNRVRVLRSSLPVETRSAARTGGSAEDAARLRSLGYLSGSAPRKASYGPEDDPKSLVELDSRLHRLVDLYQTGRLQDAMALCRAIVRERPSMQTGYDFLSLLQQQAGDDPASIATLEEGDRRGLLSEDLKSRLGLLYAEMGRNREALRVLEPLAESSDPEVLNAVGIARAGAGEMEPALQAFRRALDRDPRNAVAFQNMGIAFLQHGQVDRALEAFSKAFALNDKLPRAWNACGVALERSGKPAEAVGAWKKAVALDPNQFDALFNIALVAGRSGDTGSSREALEDFVARAPASRYAADIVRARRLLAGLPGKR
jgi:Flp pilus assembly protein TadD